MRRSARIRAVSEQEKKNVLKRLRNTSPCCTSSIESELRDSPASSELVLSPCLEPLKTELIHAEEDESSDEFMDFHVLELEAQLCWYKKELDRQKSECDARLRLSEQQWAEET
jgi:hypothetical protein